MGWVFILVSVAVWIISPIPLLILWQKAKNNNQKRTEYLWQLYHQGRITVNDLLAAGIKLPNAQPQQPALPAAPQPVQQSPEQMLADAAERAARIADAELGISEAAEIPVSVQPVIPETESIPETAEIPAAEIPEINAPSIPAEEPLPEPEQKPEFAPVRPAAAHPQPAEPAAPLNVPTFQMPKHSGFNISAISFMLSVGVLLIITAGLIFVRTQWETLSDFGRLATLAAGSGLFFGASALAHRVWKLERTGSAFYTLGAAFLPISIWAAGYLHLLGDGLSGADNPWLYFFALTAFTVTALLAVKIYNRIGWGIAFLCGGTGAYLSLVFSITGNNAQGNSVRLFAAALYALALTFSARVLRQKQLLPLAVGRVIEPFALTVTGCTSFAICSIPLFENSLILTTCAAFLTAFTYFTPVITERIRSFSAIPVTALSLFGFGRVMLPLYHDLFYYVNSYDRTVNLYCTVNLYGLYFAMLCMICASVWLLLLLTNSLPDHVRKGYYYAAAALTGTALLSQTIDIAHIPVLVPAAALVLLCGWLLAGRKAEKPLLHYIIDAQVWGLCLSVGFLVQRLAELKNNPFMMLLACLFLGAFAVLAVTKKHRTAPADLILLISSYITAVCAVWDTQEPFKLAFLLSFGIPLLCWFLALEHDRNTPVQHIYAVLSPIMLFFTCVASSNCLFTKVDSVIISIGWSITSFTLGAVTYFSARGKFRSVRKLHFALSFIPPLFFAVFGEVFDSGKFVILQQIICAAAALGLWRLFSNRGFKHLAAGSFGTSLLLMVEATADLVSRNVYDGQINFTVFMIASVWIIALSILAVTIRIRMVRFVGCDAIVTVMQIASAFTAAALSTILLGLAQDEWDGFYFVYVFGLCFLAWFTTYKKQIILPAVSAYAFFICINALRYHSTATPEFNITLLLLFASGMTVLFPYLGSVLRENEEKTQNHRRTYVLTGLGGSMTFLPLIAAVTQQSEMSYTENHVRWLVFFFPILMAGYILHFTKLTDDFNVKRRLLTVSAALGVFAFWIQPIIDVKDTYLEGKLHILPLIAFSLVIRRLYGKTVGGNFLFATGIYTMLRLAFQAMASEAAEDIVTVLFVALVIFIGSFYIKQKKWFLLGGISLISIAVYLHMKMTEGMQWWVYLLLTGLVLIVVAAVNEMLKQRGDSLKSRAGRLWEDWKW